MTNSRSLIKFIWGFCRPYKLCLFLMSIFFIALAAEKLALPYIFSLIIDKIVVYNQKRDAALFFVRRDIVLLVFVIIFIEFCYRCKEAIHANVVPKILSDIRMFLISYLQSRSMDYFYCNSIGNIASRISNIPKVVEDIIDFLIEIFIPSVITSVLSIALLGFVDIYICISFAVWFCVHITLTLYFVSKCSAYSSVHAESAASLHGVIVDSIKNIINVRLFCRQKNEMNFIKKYQDKEVGDYRKMYLYIMKLKAILSVCITLEFLFLIIITFKRWQSNILSIGDFVFIFEVATNIMDMVLRLSLESGYFFEYVGICRQSLSIFDFNYKNVNDGKVGLVVESGCIEYCGVNFGYKDGKKLFKNLNIKIGGGSKVGVVGAAGSGKTSFANLLLKMHSLESGKILIDNQDIYKKISDESLLKNIAVVPQEIAVFNRSIADNILYGNLNATRTDMINISKEVFLHNFIMSLPGQYDTLIGENGICLSVGQKQLLGIARAILKDSPIIILDEPTASLDVNSEISIEKSIARLAKNKTIIIIAHRMSTLVSVDRILVFKDGEIIEDGEHDELIARDTHYFYLWGLKV